MFVIAILGAGGSHTLSEMFREKAQKAWEDQAARSEQWLSGTVLSWLDESYAPLSGIAVLFENSQSVTEDEFLGAVDALEARATAIFIDAMAIVRPIEVIAGQSWTVQFTTDISDTLATDAVLDQVPQLIEAIEVAASRAGQTVLGSPFTTDSGLRYSPVALAISDAQGDMIIVGLMNYDALVAGLFEVHKPQGAAFRIEGRFPTVEGPGSLISVIGEAAPGTLFSSTTRTITAGADLYLAWDFGPEFAGGPDQELADFSLWSGLGATTLIAVFIAFLLSRNRTISERVRIATADLEASVQRFRVLFDASSDPYLILDGERFSDCNQAAVDLLRYNDKQELLARHPGELSPESQPDGEPSKDKAEAMIAIAHSQGRHRFDWVHRKKDGEDFPVEVTLTPIDLGGKQVLLVVWHDLTDRKRAEKEIAARERQFRNLVETIPGTVYQCLMDKDWTMLFISDEVERLSGYPASDFVHNRVRTFASIIHPEDEGHVEEVIAAAVANHQRYTVEYRTVDANGAIHSVYEQGQAIYDGDGAPESLVGTVIDISERKAAEDALHKQETHLRTIIDNLPSVVILKDLEGRHLTVNSYYELATGVSPHEVIGRTDAEFMPPDVARAIMEMDQEIMRSGEPRSFEEQIPHPDGTLHSYLTTKVPVRDDNGFVYALAVLATDITERKTMEEALLEAKEQAEEATRAKSDFLANMSHEIRTPMNAIIGLSHLALGTELDRKQHDYLTKIQGSANNLLGIINDILDFSKIEAGKLDMESVDFDLAEVLDNLANVVSVKSGEKGLELIVDLDPEVPLGLKGDPLRLNQILVNLANNAIKFTEEGEITIAARLAERNDEGVMLRFSVQDTGIGMTPEQQGRLFQAFSQADTSTTRKFGGTGLGLSISKRLTEMMGGEIGVDSEPGQGSTFWFTARFGIGAKPKPRAQRALPEELQDLRVLVVDDHPTARTIFARYLESFGFEIGEAASGAEALDELEAADLPYRLVLMDWKMPGMDGIEASRRIRASEKVTTQPEIIMVSAYGREELMEQAEVEGIKSFLVKPVSPSTLLDAVLDAMGHEVERVPEAVSAVPAQQQLRGARVLLVEDNEINQQVAEELLGQAGIDVTIANDGKQGVDILAARPRDFDGVLMDIQMPVMDGYSATREIRKDNRFKDIPVIAMTANAMAGDREKALESGMNDHVAKPIDVKELFEVLGRWIEVPETRRGQAIEVTETGKTSDEGLPEIPGIDTQAGLARCGGNEAVYRKILDKFRETQADTPRRIRAALGDGDGTTAQREAHTLKGVAGNIGAEGVQAAAKTVEGLIKEDKDSEEALSELEQTLQALIASMPLTQQPMEAKPEGATAVSDGELMSLLDRLRTLLEESDAEALDVVNEIASRIADAESRKRVKEIGQLIDDFEFDDALALLDAVRETLGQQTQNSAKLA